MNSLALVSLYQIESFGTRSIYSYLRSKDIDSHLIMIKEWISLTLDKISKKEVSLLTSHLKKIKPGIVGITVRSIFVPESIMLTKAIRKALPDSKIVWGGVHPTIAPEECIDNCDALVIGEGEKPMYELIKHYNTPKFYTIKNTWIWKGSKLIKNPIRGLNDLNALPFQDLDDTNKVFINKNKMSSGDPLISRIRNGNYNFMASRGCPFKCAYCNNWTLIKQQCSSAKDFLRYRDVDLVIKELKDIKKKFHVKRFSSNDEVFVLDQKWFRDFADKYIKDIGLPFHCQVHPIQVTEDNLRIFRKLGLKSISIGIQSGNEDTRIRIYNRPTPDSMLIEKARLLKKYNILPYYDIIVGNPIESNDSVKDALKLLLRFPRPFGLNLYKLRNLPGTELTEKLLEEGLITKDDVDGIHTKDNKRSYLIVNKLDDKNRELTYFSNLAILIGTIFVIKTKEKNYAFSPYPKQLIHFLKNRKFYRLVNSLTRLIKLQMMFFSFTGQKISNLLSKD